MRRGIRLTSYASPCMNCEDRHVGCHSECEKYKQFRADIDEHHRRWAEQGEINRAIKGLQHKMAVTRKDGGRIDYKEFSKRRK